jgi:hypothetical protein
MIAQLQIRVGRPVLEFLQHTDAVLALLQVLFPHETRPRPVAESDIDWEDGEPHREREAETAAH